MRFTIEAACGCHPGKVRRNNEDNFYFNGKCLESENSGLRNPVCLDGPLNHGLCLSIFDGMGGENFGELAAYAAAHQMQLFERTLADFFVPEKKYLNRMCEQLNQAVVDEKNKQQTAHMGTTMAALYFTGRYVYVCNIGDSRAYRLRHGEFLQLSQDHVESHPGIERKKAPLTQHLGINPDDMLIEPYIAKGKLEKDDLYLLCSDGLTDMLTNFEISNIMLNSEDTESCVQNLIHAALAQGGRDNITVIVCRLT